MTIDVAIAIELTESSLERLRGVSADVQLMPLGDGARSDAAVVLGGDPLNPQQARSWWQLSCTGVEGLTRHKSLPHGVVTTNASGVESVVIGQYVMAAMLDHAQRGVARRAAHERRDWDGAVDALYGASLRHTTVLVVGYGSIGREVARLARAFGMRVIACKARPDQVAHAGFLAPGTGDPMGEIPDRMIGLGELGEAAGEADYLVLALPLTDRTRGVVGEAVLRRLPERAFVVNVGRGAVLDEDALVCALREQRIAGAALDVFTQEPLDPASELWLTPGLAVTPHIAGAPDETTLVDLFVENLRRYVEGEQLLNVVDLSRGY